jgi:class 3 adenylate cyclase
MAAPTKKNLDQPDERLNLPGITADVVQLGDTPVIRSVFEPGIHCAQISHEGKPTCMAHHTGVVLSGRLRIQMDDGPILEIGPNEVYDIPAGHDGWAAGEEPMTTVSWAGFRSWMPQEAGERVLVTLLMTDIVGSTEHLSRVGDSAWRETLARHFSQVRTVLDRYRGREITTTGDGVLARFDGAARAVHAAIAIRDQAERQGIAVRVGVHSGEVELVGSDVRGVAVHEVARIASAAADGEILVSATTHQLASGAGLVFEERGSRELKGLAGLRTVFAVTQPSSSPH